MDIVIVANGTHHGLRRCLESLKAHLPSSPHDVMVVAAAHLMGIGRLFLGGPLAQYRAPDVERGPVDAVNGAFMLIRRGALEQVGLFDEGYWMYMEDLDLCYRLKQGGWVTWYEPSVSALHVKRGTTAGLRSPRLVWAFHYGMLRFYRTHYAPPRRRATTGSSTRGSEGERRSCFSCRLSRGRPC